MRHTFFCIDGHACGNPCRVVAGGAPALKGDSLADYRQDFLANHDWVRKGLMFEPRGHDVMSGVILYPALRDDCDIGYLFIEVSGCLPMCGHDTIGATTYALEEGLVQPREPGRLAIETPAGRVDATYSMKDGYVEEVRIFNVASYLHAKDLCVEADGLGRLSYDIAYGGNFYAIIEPQDNWAGLDAQKPSELIAMSQKVRAAIEAQITPEHPQDSRIRGVSHVMWCDAPKDPKADARNAVFYGDKAIDRSPCGTGTSARMAQLAARGELKDQDTFVHESIIGTHYHCKIEKMGKLGEIDCIYPSIGGWSRITGHNTIFIDDRDPFAQGFQLS